MIFSKTSEYAIRALSFMAGKEPKGTIGVHEVSKGTDVPPAYVAKIFQGLAKARILVSERGPGGGYRFKRDPGSVTLLEIINVIDNMKCSPLSGCIMGMKKCSDQNPCTLHSVWVKSREQMVELMGSSSILTLSKVMGNNMFSGEKRRTLSKRIRSVFNHH